MVNAIFFEKELVWLKRVIDLRLKLYFSTGEPEFSEVADIPPPELIPSPYAELIRTHDFGWEERLALVLCLAVHFSPRSLDIFFTKNTMFDRPFTEFGGLVPDEHSGFLPTGETLLFLLAGGDLEKRMHALSLLDPENPLLKFGIIELLAPADRRPRHKGIIRLGPAYESQWVYGKAYHPEFSVHFPAQRIASDLDWEEDLVLPMGARHQLEEIRLWLENKEALLRQWPVGTKLRPGYRALFYGPPGTGKTFTASLLGKETGREVYRIDLSLVISKYIGETEKNLAKVFDMAAHRAWILFFDEADALFGKRTAVQSSHDRFANQEISYLLQRLETFDGITILATNLRGNIDEAFLRRFESIIYFPMPGPELRRKIWENVLVRKNGPATLSEEVDLYALAEQFELSGGGILNVARYASLRAIAGGGLITRQMLEEGVGREFWKEGRSV